MYKILYIEKNGDIVTKCDTVIDDVTLEQALAALKDSQRHMNREKIYCRKEIENGLPKLILDISPAIAHIFEIRKKNNE